MDGARNAGGNRRSWAGAKTETESTVRHDHANCLSERENKETTERKTRTEIAKRITLHRTGLRRASISAAGKFVPCILYAVVARTNPAHASGEAARLQSETHTVKLAWDKQAQAQAQGQGQSQLGRGSRFVAALRC